MALYKKFLKSPQKIAFLRKIHTIRKIIFSTKTPEKKVSEMTGKELTGFIAKGIVGGIFALYGGMLLIAFFAAVIKKLSEIFGG